MPFRLPSNKGRIVSSPTAGSIACGQTMKTKKPKDWEVRSINRTEEVPLAQFLQKRKVYHLPIS